MQVEAKSEKNAKIAMAYASFLICVFFFLLWNLQTQRQYFADSDGYSYYHLALRILNGEISTSRQIQKWSPGYPLMLIAMNFFTRDYFLAAKLLMATFGTLYIMSSMLISQLLLKNHVYTIVFGINIFIKTAIWATLALITDIPFAFLFQMAFYFLLLGLKSNTTSQSKNITQKDTKNINRNYILAGIFTGLACLVRWTGIILLLIGVCLCLFPAIVSKNPIREKIKHTIHLLFSRRILLYLLFSFLIWAFWLIPNWLIFGSPFHSVIYLEPILWGPEYAQYEINHTNFTNIFDIILYDPKLFLKNLFFVLGWHSLYFIYEIFMSERLIFDLGQIPAICLYCISFSLMVYGIIKNIRKERCGDEPLKNKNILHLNKNEIHTISIAIVFLILLYLVLSSISVAYRRFLFPITPFGTLFFVIGVREMVHHIKNVVKISKSKIIISKSSQKLFISLIFIAITVCNGWGGYYHIGREINTKYLNSVELEIVGDFLKEHTNSTKISFPRNNYWYYYKPEIYNISSVDYFPNTFEQLQTLQTDFIVFSEGYDETKYPQFDFLLTPNDPHIPPNFEVIFYKNVTYEDWVACNSGYCLGIEEKTIVVYYIHHL